MAPPVADGAMTPSRSPARDQRDAWELSGAQREALAVWLRVNGH